MKASVFVGVSLDGFIARPDGSFELSADGRRRAARVRRVLLLGRRDGHRAEDVRDGVELRRVALRREARLRSSPLTRSLPRRPARSSSACRALRTEIVDALTARGIRHIYVDGGLTIQSFVRAGLVDRLVITRVPVLVGPASRCSVPSITTSPSSTSRRDSSERLVQSEYLVSRAGR